MKIFIGNLPGDGRIKAEDLRPLFEQFGTVSECDVVEKNIKNICKVPSLSIVGYSVYYGFVHMQDEVSATKAISRLNGYTIKKKIITVEKSTKNYPRYSPFNSNQGDESTGQQPGEDWKTKRYLKTALTIPEPSWTQWKNNDSLFEVIVTEVYSPDIFFIQFTDDLTSSILDDLMDSMEDFYDANGDDYKIKYSSFVVGLTCAIKFSDGIWYRGRITFIDITNVEVFFVDYGTLKIVSREILCYRYLLDKFSQLPCQAIKSQLTGVKSAMEEWPTQSSMRFLELVSGPSADGGLLAYVTGVGNEDENKLSLWLVDTITTNLKCGIQINQVMLDQGFAVSNDQFNNNNLTRETTTKNKIDSPLTTCSVNSSKCDEIICTNTRGVLVEYKTLMKYKKANIQNQSNSVKFNFHNKIFVGGLSSKTTKKSLTLYFSQYGKLVIVSLLDGFGFVTFAEEKQVDACQERRPHMLDGVVVDTKRAMPREELRTITKGGIKKILVGELNDEVEDSHLLKYFGQFGSLTSLTRMTDKEAGENIDFAFLEFDDYDVVDKIILKSFHKINGVNVDVTKALSKRDAFKISKSA